MRYLLFLLLWGTCLAQGGLSDEDVLRLVNAGREPAAQLQAVQIRSVRTTAFPGIILVGYLTGTRGCLLGTVIVDGKPLIVAKAAGEVLRARGWEKADADQRCDLARTWVEKVMLAFGETVVAERPADWPKQSRGVHFAAPDLRATSNGGVQLVTWIQEESGPDQGNSYRKNFYIFGPNGDMLRARVMERFQTEGPP